MNIQEKSGKYSLLEGTRRFLLLLVPILLVSILFNMLAILYTREEQNDNASLAVKAYSDSIDREIGAITRIEAKMVVDYVSGKGPLYTSVQQILYGPDTLTRIKGQQDLESAFSIYYFDYINRFHFFLYFPDRTLYLPCDSLQRQVEVEKLITQRIMDGSINAYAPANDWDVLYWEDTVYLVKSVHYQGIWFGYWLRAEDMVSVMNELTTAGGGEIVLETRSGVPLTTAVDAYQGMENGIFSDVLAIRRKFAKIPFAMVYYLPVSGIFRNILWMQMILALLSLATSAAVALSYLYTYRRVLKPIQQFCAALSNYTEETLDPDSTRLLELEQATRQLNSLTDQIRSLKLALYERQVAQQREMIRFMRLQIKPHFYLNCLNLAHNMIEQGRYGESQEMLRFTADYFRYLLRSDMRCVRIGEEMTYVEKYLRIQSIRYEQTFRYDLEQDPEAVDCLIPPLIIQTFVENAVKYAISAERTAEISVSVMREERGGEEQIDIFVTDTGAGFPEKLLSRLRRGEELAPEEGIGITNSLQRLRHQFGHRFSIAFYNTPLGGAVVELSIPAVPLDEVEDNRSDNPDRG